MPDIGAAEVSHPASNDSLVARRHDHRHGRDGLHAVEDCRPHGDTAQRARRALRAGAGHRDRLSQRYLRAAASSRRGRGVLSRSRAWDRAGALRVVAAPVPFTWSSLPK